MQTVDNLIQNAWREYAKLRIALANDHASAVTEIEQSWPDEIASELDAAGDDWLLEAIWQLAALGGGGDKLRAALDAYDSDMALQALSREQRSWLLGLCLA